MLGMGLKQAAILLVLAAPAPATADWIPAEWWRACRDCPRGDYSLCHYWFTGYYRLRACLHPSNLDQYPPGPCPPPAPSVFFLRYRCPPLPPAPSSPYADPAAYYPQLFTTESPRPPGR